MTMMNATSRHCPMAIRDCFVPEELLDLRLDDRAALLAAGYDPDRMLVVRLVGSDCDDACAGRSACLRHPDP